MKRRDFLAAGVIGASALVGRSAQRGASTKNLPHIGVATADITPPIGAVMVGYQARSSTGVAHRLRAEALVCRGAEGAWALITSDTIGHTAGIAREIRAAIAAATGIPANATILSGTHTHSGPCTVIFGREENLTRHDTDYLAALPAKMVDLAKRALADAAPGYFETATTAAPEFGHNRRVRKPDGKWGNEWQDPEGRHTGFYDPTILLVAVRRADGRRDGLLVNFGCHPVVLGPRSRELSDDYVTYLRERLEREGAAKVALFALSGCGNINPRVCIQGEIASARMAGEALAGIVLEAMPRLAPISPGVVAAHGEPWSFVRTREVLKFKERGQDQRIGDPVQTELVAARAGELGLVAIPGELFSEFNGRIRRANLTRDTVIVTMANDYVGYLPTDQAQQERAYETTVAPADKLEIPLMEHVERALARI